MENLSDKENDDSKGYTPDADNEDGGNNESQEPTQNLKWDQAQRRQQAGPRSYNESTESQNIANQNTDADNEQIGDEDNDDPNDPKDIGDQISERQQNIVEKNSSGDRKSKKKE